MKIVIDGSVSGFYRADCECGFNWFGHGQHHSDGYPSPALPIAEAVVHCRMTHEDQRWDLRFTERFQKWLEGYWMRADAKNGLGQATLER